jgi:undecaprenyl-diphosphatase
MDFLHTLILSFVEGITEFLPISSTGHLILVTKLLNIPESEFTKSFDIIIQSGAILAVVVIYANRLLKDFETLKRVLVAYIPTAIIGFLTYKIVKSYLLGNISLVLWSLLLGGIAIIVLEFFFKGNNKNSKGIKDLTYLQSMGIGVIQCISFIPGVSRAATSIFGGMFMGLSRKEAVELSFMVSIPTMFSATLYDLLKTYKEFNTDQINELALGFILAFVSAYISVKWLLKFVSHNSFIVFGVYRIVLAIILFLILGI